MSITGNILINGQWLSGAASNFSAVNPATGTKSLQIFSNADIAQVDNAVELASTAFDTFSQYSDTQKATLLRSISAELEIIRPAIIEQGTWETALPEMRIDGELSRTIGQLSMFAQLLEKGDWKRPVIEQAQPNRKPLPKPDLRLTQVPLGPVVVFSASNFPLAFSVAGGDTASALAAGCPVIVKTHSAHPATSELIASAILKAIETCGAPKAIFAMLHGSGRTIGTALVRHPKVKAVGFTGSITGGRALYDVAVSRPEPIPFFGELGSTNPVYILPQSLEEKAEQIAGSFLDSLMMGVGQFCTSPGMLIAVKGSAFDRLFTALAEKAPTLGAGSMLTAGICDNYNVLCAKRSNLTIIGRGSAADNAASQAQVSLFSIDATDYLANLDLEQEVFGPSSLVIGCESQAQMLEVAASMKGHLTGAIFAQEKDHNIATKLLPILQQRIGRVLFDGFGTGVELSSAMSHGGPYPSSSASQTTSVGTRAIERFTRPLCYQNTPDALLPIELQNANPGGIMRLVNNQWSDKSII